jgi:membrane protein implicated in regulation of membrane protease activity
MSGGFVMLDWWNGMTLLEQILACIAVPSTLLLVIQLIMTIVGLGDDSDGDIPDDLEDDVSFDDADGDIGLRVFTIRGLTAFFTLLGWVGLSVSRTGAHAVISIMCGVLAGVVAMFLIALLVKYAMKLQDDGTLDYKNALGLSGTVYITIPAKRLEKGKINIMLQGHYMELEAVTDEDEDIKFGTEIVVIGLSGTNTLVVKRK